MRTLLDKAYNDEDLYDIERDVLEATGEDNTPYIPKGDYDFRLGMFRVVITWTPNDET